MICTVCKNDSTRTFPLCNTCVNDELVCIYSPNILYQFGVGDHDLKDYNVQLIKIPNEIHGWGYYLVSELEEACDKFFKDYVGESRSEKIRKWRYFKNKKNRNQLRIDREKLAEKQKLISINVKDILIKYDFEGKDSSYNGTVDKIITDHCKKNPDNNTSDLIKEIVGKVIEYYTNSNL